jgi:hypothetical protein
MARGRLAPGFHVADTAKTPYAMTVGDLNADGHPDIVFGYTEGPHAVFFNDGNRPPVQEGCVWRQGRGRHTASRSATSTATK